MGTPRLQVTVAGLRALATRCEALAGELTTTLSATGSSWQSSAAAVSATDASAVKTGNVLNTRMRANSTKIAHAATSYELAEGDGTARLSNAGESVVLV